MAPWSAAEVGILNAYQQAGVWHPFTCGEDSAPLVATQDGWICSKCEFTQGWAWSWMTDRARWPQSMDDGA